MGEFAVTNLLYTVALVLALVLIVEWIFLPFAIFGTKKLLREIRDELRVARKPPAT